MLCLWMPEGTNDSSFAMTSSYTAMLVACAAIFATDSDSLNQAIESARVVLDNLVCRAQALAAGHFNRLVVLGAGCLHATAREALLEVCRTDQRQAYGHRGHPPGIQTRPEVG